MNPTIRDRYLEEVKLRQYANNLHLNAYGSDLIQGFANQYRENPKQLNELLRVGISNFQGPAIPAAAPAKEEPPQAGQVIHQSDKPADAPQDENANQKLREDIRQKRDNFLASIQQSIDKKYIDAFEAAELEKDADKEWASINALELDDKPTEIIIGPAADHPQGTFNLYVNDQLVLSGKTKDQFFENMQQYISKKAYIIDLLVGLQNQDLVETKRSTGAQVPNFVSAITEHKISNALREHITNSLLTFNRVGTSSVFRSNPLKFGNFKYEFEWKNLSKK